MCRERTHWTRAALLLGLAAFAPFAIAAAGRPAAGEPVAPVAVPEAADAAKIALGERLFHDRRLSHGNVASCASCHRLERGGDDGRTRPVAADGEPLDFNAPTVFNVGLNFRLNWRGNFRTLEEHNEAVLLDASLMNTSWEELLPKLSADTDYARAFAAVFAARPGRESVLDALAAYQRSLVTPNAPFDRYLDGDPDAITAEEEHGYRLFKNYGCTACHQGVNVGGNLFQKFGIFEDPFAGRPLAQSDLGRFTITGRKRDRRVFRVPSLRNVAVTAPYFHHGRTESLEEAVEIMARNQLGREIAAHDVELIVRFLGTLTGEYRGRSLTGRTPR